MTTTGVIVFGSDQEVKDLMKAVSRKNATGHFSWIGSDGWSARTLVSNGNEAVVEGTLSVQPRAENVKGFKEYFLQLSPRSNHRNPWFVGRGVFLKILRVFGGGVAKCSDLSFWQVAKILAVIFGHLPKRSLTFGQVPIYCQNPDKNWHNLKVFLIPPKTLEFWEHHFLCKYPNSSKTPYNQNYDKYCTGDEKLEKSMAFEDQLQYVSDAVMSFAYAFR